MSRYFIFIILLASFGNVKSQENYRNFKYYSLYEDYVANKPIEPFVNTIAKKISSEYIIVGKKFDKSTNKRSKKENLAWAFEYENKLYFNMIYAQYIYSWDTFAKFDIIGDNYMAIILDETKDRKAIGMENRFRIPNSSWFDKNGNSFKVLLINRKNPFRVKGSGMENVLAHLIDADKVAEISNYDKEVIYKLTNKELSLEDLINLVNQLNKQH